MLHIYPMKENDFLKEKYNLHNAPEAKKAAERTESRIGEKIPQDPDIRIQNYLDRLERLALDPNKEQEKKPFRDEPRPRALSLLREMVMNKYVRPRKEKWPQARRGSRNARRGSLASKPTTGSRSLPHEEKSP